LKVAELWTPTMAARPHRRSSSRSLASCGELVDAFATFIRNAGHFYPEVVDPLTNTVPTTPLCLRAAPPGSWSATPRTCARTSVFCAINLPDPARR